ncbi:FAD binding domain-containing protein [Aldersonia kunmingensis]|uniref:FAD binding domain-containing protein n=1 Tax=Aldersonia kunmingensis TaxID=408066 RepID=UPI00082AF61C|nr:FAD binding domain-containing protein [Aldersonia kunmingensis]
MDLPTIDTIAVPRTRAEIDTSGAGVAFLAGGTWLFSEPQDDLRKLVDLTGLGWPPITVTDDGLELAATATIEQLVSAQVPGTWKAQPLFRECASALLASFKIWHSATVGGNLCLSLPAGAMITLCAALDGSALVWRSDGSQYRVPVLDFVTGAGRNVLLPGEVLRSVTLPRVALRSRTAFRKVALAPLGRSGAVLVGRVDAGGEFALTVTAATDRPYVLRFPTLPAADELRRAISSGIPGRAWYDDAHGSPDWRAAVTQTLAQQIREELV